MLGEHALEAIRIDGQRVKSGMGEPRFHRSVLPGYAELSPTICRLTLREENQTRIERAMVMTSSISVIGEDIIAVVESKAAAATSELEIGDVVLDVISDHFIDPRAVPLEDVKSLLCHAMASYRREVTCPGQIAV